MAIPRGEQPSRPNDNPKAVNVAFAGSTSGIVFPCMHDPALRIQTLRARLDEANRAYYVDASPIMPDREYDDLLAELAELELAHPELDDPASPTKRVGGEPIEGFETVAHAVRMMSIDNTYAVKAADADGKESLESWVERMKRAVGDGVRFVCDPKIDGVALSLRYERGRLTRAVTRGDGTKGDNVTHAACTIRAIPLRLDTAVDVLEVRGEVFIPRPEFERINLAREQAGDEPFMNPRNACAGTIKQLDPSAIARRRLRFIAHGIGEAPQDFAASYSKFTSQIRALGLPVSDHQSVHDDLESLDTAITAFERTRTR